MIISTITQQGRNLSCDIQSIPAQFSVDLEFKLIKDSNYTEYVVTPYCAYSQNKFIECESDLKVYPLVIKDAIFKVPKEILNRSGYLIIAISLSSNNEVFQTLPIVYKIQASIGGTDVLPEDIKSWQQLVIQTVDDRIALTFTKPMNDLIEEAKKQQEVFNTLQEDTRAIINSTISSVEEMNVKINNSISNLGQYEIISKDPTKVKFKKGNGEYGEIVDLGTDLASKSLVNAGYEIASGNTYSGASSECGINVTEIEGNYEQKVTKGYQLFDASKLPTKVQDGIIVTNNGDGSFTITGSGDLINDFGFYYDYSHEETVKLLKKGVLKYTILTPTKPFFYIYIYENNSIVWSPQFDKTSQFVITEEMINNETFRMRIGMYGNNNTAILPGTVKPMLYQEGDGTFEPFTGAVPSPNPEYAQEPKFVDIKEFNSHTRNLFDASKLPSKTQGGATITNNGDGSFTVSGSGNLTATISHDKIFTHKETVSLLRKGILKCNATNIFSYPYFYIFGYQKDILVFSNYISKTSFDINITDEMLADETFYVRIGYYGDVGKVITPQTIKPMIYQDGDGIFEPFKLEGVALERPLQLVVLPNGVCDTYGNGVITRRVGKVVIDETIKVIKNEASESKWLYYIIMNDKNFKPINNYIFANNLINRKVAEINKGNEKSSIGVAADNPNYKVIFFNIGYYLSTNTVAAVKEYLRTHPITVYYELETSVIEQFSIPILPSYYPNTVIQHNSQIDAKNIIWNVNSYAVGKASKKELETVAFTGNYADLTGKLDITFLEKEVNFPNPTNDVVNIAYPTGYTMDNCIVINQSVYNTLQGGRWESIGLAMNGAQTIKTNLTASSIVSYIIVSNGEVTKIRVGLYKIK